jgi:hypothetical protein
VLIGPPTASIKRRTTAIATSLASSLFLVATPMAYDPKECFGVLWRFSELTPAFVGSQLVFWVLVPLGIYSFIKSCFPATRASLWLPVWAVLYVIPYAINPITAQRYVDPYAIAFHSFALAARRGGDPRVADAALLVLAGICIAFNCMRFVFHI